jgi:2-polyprenyl-6-methoxyphenol hydroxylase-like FAD-dependent oxidoreductase
MRMDATETVVVVGAGPTGLLLAGDLAAAGVACTVLERRAELLREALAAWCGEPVRPLGLGPG